MSQSDTTPGFTLRVDTSWEDTKSWGATGGDRREEKQVRAVLRDNSVGAGAESPLLLLTQMQACCFVADPNSLLYGTAQQSILFCIILKARGLHGMT
jgi:hypothetical protein